MWRLRRLSAAARLKNTFSRGWMARKLARRTSWPGHELATAVGAYALQYGPGARRAKRAFKGTDTGFAGVRREVFVTALAVGSKLKHGRILK